MSFWEQIKGYKTYAAALALVVTAVVQFRAGDLMGAAQSAGAALAAFGLRSALAEALLKLLPVPAPVPAKPESPQPPV